MESSAQPKGLKCALVTAKQVPVTVSVAESSIVVVVVVNFSLRSGFDLMVNVQIALTRFRMATGFTSDVYPRENCTAPDMCIA